MIGMNFQQAVIVGLILKTSYDYRYGISADHDCNPGFRACCDISSHGPVIFIIIFSFCSQLHSGYDSVAKKLAPNFHTNVPPPSSVSRIRLQHVPTQRRSLSTNMYGVIPHKFQLFENFISTTLFLLVLNA